MISKGKLGILATATALLGTFSANEVPAHAATVPITFTSAAGCGTCRTLHVSNSDGSTPAAVNLSSGSGGFIADVVDSGIDPAVLGNFDVEATLSNLYKTTNTGFDCTAPKIPAGDVSLQSLPALLDANGLNAVLQPIFNITGNLSTLNSPVLAAAGIVLPSSTTISNVTGQVNTTVNQAVMAGNSLTDLTGSILGNGTLPFNLSAVAGGAFTNSDPTSSPCPDSSTATPTQRQVLAGALNALPGPLQGELQTVLNTAFNSGAPSNPTLTWLINNGYVTASTAESLISTSLGIPETLLNSVTGLVTSIENTLTAAVSSVVSGATTLTGTYGADPALAIAAPNASPGSYQAVLTLTLTSS